jgi:EmrB/QacA subfamily drug resistance transporter
MSSVRRTTGRGVILALVCAAQFMVILDFAVVNVALPSVQADLHVDQSDLQWVVITYGLTFGGFLLLGGRAADLLGRRRVLAAGLTLFTAASLGAALSSGLGQLVISRGLQGLGAAMAAPAAISILANTFAEGPERNKALGIFGAVAGSAGSVGVTLSGALSSGPGWQWIFFINVPIGVVLVTCALALIPDSAPAERGSADLVGAVTVTAGLMAVVYGINKSVDFGWTSATTVGFLAGGAALLGLFLVTETKAGSPILPLAMFRRRTLSTSIVVSALMWGSFFATLFEASLFMQQVLRYSAIRTGLAYLAIALTVVVVSAGIAARLVGRFGPARILVVGQVTVAAGLVLLSRAPSDAVYISDLFPGFVALGVGMGISAPAAQVAAFTGIDASISGLAGGMVETAREIGGAFGTAVVATVAIARADQVAGPADVALTEGFQRGAVVAAGISLASALAAGLLLRRAERAIPAGVPVEMVPEPALVPQPELAPAIPCPPNCWTPSPPFEPVATTAAAAVEPVGQR